MSEPDTKNPSEDDNQPILVESAVQRGIGDVAQFNEDITISYDKPGPAFDIGPVKAYAAKGTAKIPENLIALVCEDHLTPRASVASKYARIDNPHMAHLIATGPVYWPPAGREKYVFIYNKTFGVQLLEDDNAGGMGLKSETVTESVVKPLLTALQDLRDKDVFHGTIRPSNIYTSKANSLDGIVLGDCLALPPSYNMNAIYEPIERAMADPLGRGTGTLSDDLYSFGVMLTVLMRTGDPMHGLSEEDVIKRKLEEGTYFALTGKDRFKGSVLELLRGLLHDDVDQRWTLEEMEAWMDGQRLSPKQAAKKAKASRPLVFNGGKYIRPELLAHSLSNNVSEAMQIIENGSMDQWLQRALEDKIIRDHVQTAVDTSANQHKGPDHADALVARVSMALNPDGPMYYKNIRVMPDGLGPLLTAAFIKKEDLQVFVDFFNQYFVMQWVNMQTRTNVDVGAVVSKYDSCKAFLRQTAVGFGLERCVYIFNPESPCLSEKLKDYYVRNPEDIMSALEGIAHSPARPDMCFDRHIIAFLSVKDRKNIDPYFGELNSTDRYKRVVGELKTLATIQKRSRLPKFPGLTAWMAENLDCVYERFHDRKLRQKTFREVEKLKDGGDLGKIASLFDESHIYENDNNSFQHAMRYYQALRQEQYRLMKKLENVGTYGEETGKEVAAIVSSVLAGIVILASILMAFTDIFNVR